jgi:serine-type D-Ala-D-Ala carboxypeptidase (penicillin-binding protein 5/6)
MSAGSLHGYVASGPRWGRRLALGLVVLVVLVAAAAVIQLVRSVPVLRATVTLDGTARVGGTQPRLPWPLHGAAAVEVLGVGSLGSFHGDLATPLASITKLMTALVVLKQHPLAPTASGPTIVITAADVAAYKADLASDQSVLEVRSGERLDEREALEGLLIPSANNVALILATWDAGSKTAFVARMNAMAASLGLAHTRFVEPSGLAPGNAGTAIDMTRLGADALANPTIASIVDLGEVTLPVAGTVINYDYAVGHHGIVGIKTGSSDAAGGNFVFAARRRVDGRTVTVVGAVLNQEGTSRLETALEVGERLAAVALRSVRAFTVLRGGTTAVRVRAAWSSRSVLGKTTRTVRAFGIPGRTETLRTTLGPVLVAGHHDRVPRGERLATVTVKLDGRTYAIPVTASGNLPGPSLHYRLTRP